MKRIFYSFSIALFLLFCERVQAQVTVADSLFNSKQWEKAIAAYNTHLQKYPNDKPGFQWNRIGQSYSNLKEYDKAIDAYKKSVAYNGNSTIMYNIACAYSKTSQRDSALAWLDRCADAGFALYAGALADEDLKDQQTDPQYKAILQKIKKNAMPCSVQPESHQLDFWIGDWKVFNLKGQQSGTSKIEQILGECVIQENWTDYLGGKGKSFNFYNSITKEWQQTWVDDKGGITEFIHGKYIDNALRFQSSRPDMNNGKSVLRRLTFFNINPHEVRQLGEISIDEGKTWTVEYDLKYVREK